MAIVIIGREIAVSALREWMAEIGARGRMKVSVLGKYKTIMQIVGLSMLLFRQHLLGIPIYKLGLVLTRGRRGIDTVVDDFVLEIGVAAITGQLEPVAGGASRLGAPSGARWAQELRNAGQFKALGAFSCRFFLTPGGTALQLRVCLGRE